MFHAYASDAGKGNWCHNCFSEEKRETLECEGVRVRKTDCKKQKNDFEQEEAWVECDHCRRWVHQICGLFNKGSNNSEVTYMCPDCLCEGELALLPTSASFCRAERGWEGRLKVRWGA